MPLSLRLLPVICFMLCATATAAPTVHSSDFIPQSARTNFNGFESAPTDFSGTRYAGSFPYVEGGIEVSQVNGDPPSEIWLTCGAIRQPGYCFGTTGHEGSFSWYPNGGDEGYTRLVRSDGADFESVGFIAGNSRTRLIDLYLNYTLLSDGAIILAGRVLVPANTADLSYLGFSGGGFDEVWVSETPTNGGLNGLAIDSVELAPLSTIPEPATALLLLAGVVVVTKRARFHCSRPNAA